MTGRPDLRGKARRQRGMAVISALLIVAAVAVLVTGLFQRQAASVRAVENEQARIQARWLLLGGLDWARLVLREDARRNNTTRLGELWATPVADTRITRPGDDRVALFSGRIEDEQGKYNLRNLAKAGVPQPAEIAALDRLCAMLGLPGSLAPRIAVRIASAQAVPGGSGETGTGTGTGTGAGTGTGQNGDTAQSRGPSAPMIRTVDDLEGITEVDEKTIEALRPYVTVLPENTAVNANTAPAEVLATVVPGLSLAQARALTEQRNAGSWFNDRADFGNRLANPDITISDAQIVTASKWFMVSGTVTLERAAVTMQALVSRANANSPTVVWKRETN
ncbi:type II secretion system minor pseudopilin GspK [Pigmentiphaga sp.]|uniref:type II secretion system minor pseudopilin GspK n=1 Tax=Pigmentiphaga sp. TaxID=1977564 RepID=UPI00128CDA2E|nr:type II secretion system minor pseudopilin GspK [Pigmentiphaga sp.]MPS28198.1 general secretion pathway protein GspK [Alcaligenaceae bacterium SAGV5]MPS28397.1 general secretion pathway protein GspK [Alcaligenaceae bacterium SAGV5]MPS51396.1 general secretion pathway protein GspK [Alcaligenaceae bacterium SAGV3]MPT55964.1 general secretion pathway protein GspK [Alcaligenaceae bacterium]